VILENIFPVLFDVLTKAEARTRKEAAWALSNAACGGNPEQLRHAALPALPTLLAPLL
jgi:hypothetical protein